MTHVSQVDLRGTQRKIRTNADHEKERIDYLLNRISKEKLSSSVFRKDNLRKKQVTLVHVLELFVFAGTDLFKNLKNHMITSLIAKFRQSKKESKKEVAKVTCFFRKLSLHEHTLLTKVFFGDTDSASISMTLFFVVCVCTYFTAEFLLNQPG